MTTTLNEITADTMLARDGDLATWLRDRRATAAKRFETQAWPNSRVDEFWRQTPFTKRVSTDLALLAPTTDAVVPTSLSDTTGNASASVSIVDGAVLRTVVTDEAAAAGLVVMPLSQAAVEHADLVEKHYGSLTAGEADSHASNQDRTVTANDAAWDAGVFVLLPKDVELAAPIDIHVHVTTPGAHLPRVLFVAERHSQAKVIIEHTSSEDVGDVLVDEVAEFVLLDGSNVEVVSLQEWSGDVTHLSLQKAAVHRDATFRHLAVTIGGTTVRLRPEADLIGPGSAAYPRGVYFADEGQHFDFQPYLRHIAPNATSDTLYKGALQGNCRTVFRGNVLIGENASGTVTDETNRSLILTKGAKADATPFLEIFNHDVSAGHGSATGQVDGSYLWYMQSRGITRTEALRLIVFGFFSEVIDDIDLPGVKERALAHLEREIDGADLSSIGVSDIAIPAQS